MDSVPVPSPTPPSSPTVSPPNFPILRTPIPSPRQISPNPDQLPSTPSIISPTSLLHTQTPTFTPIPLSSPLHQPSPQRAETPHSIPNITLTPPPLISPQRSQTPDSLSDLSSPEISSDESDDDFGIPLQRPPWKRMVNFDNDTELEEDYEIGWEWHEEDPGPLVAPYSGFRQCLLDPTKQNPEDFFNALFSTQMYTIMDEETNRYAQRKIQRCKFFTKYLFTQQTFFQDPERLYHLLHGTHSY